MKYRVEIQTTKEGYDWLDINANSAEEAMQIALKNFAEASDTSLDIKMIRCNCVSEGQSND